MIRLDATVSVQRQAIVSSLVVVFLLTADHTAFHNGSRDDRGLRACDVCQCDKEIGRRL
jgi:hypothetical protein